jgi:uncharacterized membrane protein
MTWSKVLTVVLALFSVVLFARHVEVLAAIFGGMSVTGFGEWIRNSTGVSRRLKWLGLLLELAGVALSAFGIYLVWVEP